MGKFARTKHKHAGDEELLICRQQRRMNSFIMLFDDDDDARTQTHIPRQTYHSSFAQFVLI